MILSNVKIHGGSNAVNIFIEGKTISGIENSDFRTYPRQGELQLQFAGATAFPGLVNSHDHLEFNLFPQFGDKAFGNYLEWSKHIHENYKGEINTVLQIPFPLRFFWGIYKNLLCGVTTVVHHGKDLAVDKYAIDVFRGYKFLHSVGLEKKWKYKLNAPSHKKLFVIHIGEGRDEYARQEIDRLIRWNLFNKDIVGVHGVAMNKEQAKSFKALVWCPASNLFMLNESARVDELKEFTQILFGTDSTLTAGWNLWEHLRWAKKYSLVSDEELMDMLTKTPAKVWGLHDHGSIGKNYVADIVIADTGNTGGNIFDLNPEDILLVLKNGEIKLFDEKLSDQFTQKSFCSNDYSKVICRSSKKYIHGNLSGIIAEVKKIYPEAKFPVAIA